MKNCFLFAIAALFISISASGQLYGRYINLSNGGLCSETIILFPNGFYNIESGCERSTHFSMGTWTKRKDTIQFREIDSSFKVINKVLPIQTGKRSLTVKIFDTDGNNVTAQYAVGQYVKGMGVYNMDLDSTQSERTDFRRTGGVIALTSLERVLGRSIEIAIDTADLYEIYLNDSVDWIFYKNSVWNKLGNFELPKTGKGLTSVRAICPDENWNLVKRVYKKE